MKKVIQMKYPLFIWDLEDFIMIWEINKKVKMHLKQLSILAGDISQKTITESGSSCKHRRKNLVRRTLF